jgi:WS/DGAT/MGAT family acyltransferase
LWEFFVIDGLRSGEVALYIKVHHARLDGQAGVALGRAIFDTTPEGRHIKPPRVRARRNQYQLGVAELLGAALSNTAQQVAKLVRTLPDIGRAAATLLLPEKDEDGRRQWRLPRDLNLFAPRTAFNVAITNQRRFAARTVPLAEVKEIAKRSGVTLNDVVMATVAGGLREYLIGHRELPVRPLSAAVPVSLRAAGDESANNQVSMVTMTLATDVADPMQRLQTIAAGSSGTKARIGRVKAAIPTDFPMLAAPWLMSGAASLYGRSRLANLLPPLANLVISNVPGIHQQLYFAGARIISYYPVSIPAHGMALNVTVQSYNGRLDYGLIGCRRAVPDIAELADALLAEHRKLLEVARGEATQPHVIEAPARTARAAEATKAVESAAPAGPKRRSARAGAALNLVRARPAGAAAGRKRAS